MVRSSVIPIFLVGFSALALLALTILAVIQRKTISALRDQNSVLQTEHERLNELRTENQAAQPLHDQEGEIQQLRENNKDLLRLRNELRTLREQNRELETRQAADAKLLAAVQGAAPSNAAALFAFARQQGARLGIMMGNHAGALVDGTAAPAGVIVNAIDAESAAADSELRPMDVIVAMDGRRIMTGSELQIEMLTKQPGQTVVLDVVRTGAVFRIELRTGAWPNDK